MNTIQRHPWKDVNTLIVWAKGAVYGRGRGGSNSFLMLRNCIRKVIIVLASLLRKADECCPKFMNAAQNLRKCNIGFLRPKKVHKLIYI